MAGNVLLSIVTRSILFCVSSGLWAVFLLLWTSLSQAQTPLGGVIGSDTTLAADTYQLTSDLSVPIGVTLTLSPGVVIKSDLGRQILVNGALVATGTSMEPITFTEVRDGSVGLPVVPGAPAPGYWNGIDVRDGASAVLTHARIRYTGNSTFLNWSIRKDGAGSLTISQSELTLGARQGLVVTGSGGSVSLSDSLIADMGQTGVLADGSATSLGLLDNQISNNGNGLQFGQFVGFSGSLTMTGNQVTGNSFSGLYVTVLPIAGGIGGNTISGNSQTFGSVRFAPAASGTVLDGSNTVEGPLRIDGGSLAAGATGWANPFTYRLAGEVSVPVGAALTLSPGTVVKADGGTQLVVQGQLDALGTPAEPVVFTEIRDDTAGGDSGFAGDPVPGAWNGIDVRDGASAVLTHARIRYTGNSTSISWALRKFGSGSLTLVDSVITQSARDGVVIQNTTGSIVLQANQIEGMQRTGVIIVAAQAAPSLQDNRIRDNGFRGLQIENASPLISGGRVSGNAEAGVWVSGADSAPELSSLWISGNAIGVDSHSGASPLIGGSEGNGNDLAGNAQFGVRNNDSSLTLNARFNWWGDASGPFDPVGNADGLGDPVSDWVDYGDFLDRSAVDGLFADRFQSPL